MRAGDVVFVDKLGWCHLRQVVHDGDGQLLGFWVEDEDGDLMPAAEFVCWWLPDDYSQPPFYRLGRGGQA